MSAKVSVIITIFNELKLGFIEKTIPLLSSCPDLEVIVVDYGSTDGTIKFLEEYKIKLIHSKHKNRATRLNQGLTLATAPMILLHHPRSLLNQDGIEELLSVCNKKIWGGFTHAFDQKDHFLYRFTSWYSNQIRFDHFSILYLDHCIFFHRELIGNLDGLIPNIDIFEDTELSKKLRKLARPKRLKNISLTSSIRFKQNGVWTQAILNQILKIGYHFKISRRIMNKVYEKGLSLNSKY